MGAETSRAEPEKGRNLWGSNPKRAETSGNPVDKLLFTIAIYSNQIS